MAEMLLNWTLTPDEGSRAPKAREIKNKNQHVGHFLLLQQKQEDSIVINAY